MTDSPRAVFLDRDGTVVEEKGYITEPDGITLVPGAAAGIAAMRSRGWKVFIATNQAHVAKGIIREEELAAINFRMVAMLAGEGAELDGIYCCIHHPEGTVRDLAVECGCRKPKPGLLERAASEHGLELDRCVMVGDTARDVEAGRAVGAKTVLVRTGKGAKTAEGGHSADYVADDLPEVAAWLDSLQV
jgi:D-glycero-D-manno-heptose 1,7-bisphosphate phosphatase